jgi:TetR/AcrR family tetracycline transcriptional repressor
MVARPQLRPDGTRATARVPLSPEDVVDAALALVDGDGFDSLSMRGLAKSMGVYPSALYWHAGNKDQLLALVCQRVLEEIALPPLDGTDWQDWIVTMGTDARRVLGSHPHLAAYFVSQLQISTSSLLLAERTLAVLSRAGFCGDSLLHAYNSVLGSIFGWISGEFAADPQDAGFAWREHFEAELRATDKQLVPTIRSNLPLVANHAFMLRWSSGQRVPMNGSFDFMLRSLTLGLAAQLDSG